MTIDLVQTLTELVAIPSVNPMGRAVDGPEYFEHRVTDYLEALFKRWNLPYQRQPVAPKRENIFARLEAAAPADRGGPLILFEAHQDTVPVTGMTIEPWSPVVRDGRLYGRGACDVKGGLTAMLGAVARLASEPPRDRPTIVMACTVNEEYGFSGATALAGGWGQAGSLIPRRPDAAIIAEPTELQTVIAHKGVVRWRCHARGRAAHSSQPQLGRNAIFKMGRVLAALERYARDVGSLGEHALCGRPTLSVGTINGGLSVNTVPDECVIEIDRRLIPGETPSEAMRHALQFLSGELGDDPEIVHDSPFLIGVGLSDRDNAQLADKLIEAASRAGVPSSKVGVPYGTNAAAIAASGVPSIVFGPGSIDQAHTADEWLALDQLALASETFYQFGRHGLAG